MAAKTRNRPKKKSIARKRPAVKKDPCKECIPAKCCMYFSVEIDAPETKKDYDDLLWIIAHKDVEIYMDEGRWYVMVQTHCRFYDPCKGCLIYPKRPKICRDHDLDVCEFEDDYNFDLHFHSYEDLDRYIKNNT